MILTGESIFILIGKLPSHDEGRIVELLIDVWFGEGRVADLLLEVRAEGLGDGEDDSTVGRLHGIPLDIVELTIGVRLLVGVNTVEVHHLQEGLAVGIAYREVGDLRTGGIAQELDVHLEIAILQLVGAERIYIFHHQLPEWSLSGYCRST